MFDPARFLTHSLTDLAVARILAAAIDSVEPGNAVRRCLESAELPAHRRAFLLGIGKAAEPMTRSAAETLKDLAAGLVITKHSTDYKHDRIKVMEAGHPIPDQRSLEAGTAALDFVSRLDEDDLLLCLISGGGSALAAAPRPGISGRDLQELTSRLLACGATIAEINTLRRRLDRLKGGGLAQATRAQVFSLILSDVIGDRPEMIASGPTAPDPTTGRDGLAILEKYGLRGQVPGSVLAALQDRPAGDPARYRHVRNIIIGNNETAARGAQGQAEIEGFQTEIISTSTEGDAGEIGAQSAAVLKEASLKRGRPFCLIAGGETTVTVRGSGRGGRNQQLALAAVEPLAGLRDVVLISLATDGDDGPTDAAGAVVTGQSRARAERLGKSAADYMSRNDAYPFFDSLGDLLKPGYTGTNVNDLIFLFAF